MGACADGAGWFLLAPEVVVSIAEASGTLGASIEVEVLGDLETLSKEEKALQGSVGVGASNDGENHRGGLLAHPLLSLSEPAGGTVEGDAWVE